MAKLSDLCYFIAIHPANDSHEYCPLLRIISGDKVQMFFDRDRKTFDPFDQDPMVSIGRRDDSDEKDIKEYVKAIERIPIPCS